MTPHGMGEPRAMVVWGEDRSSAASEISARVSAAYDAVAPAYAEKHAAMPGGLVGLGQRALARAGAGAGMSVRVLDVGCGAGRDMAWFEGLGARVIGVDRSAGMLAVAGGLVQGGLARMDMRALAFPAASFDVVWCIASLLHLPKAAAPAALAELRRVLSPAGVLALSLQAGSDEVWETGPYTSDPAGARFFARYNLDEATAMLQRGGFSVCERGVDEGPGRHWLRFLAVPGPF